VPIFLATLYNIGLG